MASEDTSRKTRESPASAVVNRAEQATFTGEGVKEPSHALLSVCKSLAAGGIAGGV